MAVKLRINPDFTNEIGVENKDSITLPEFTFHHGHVEKIINTSADLSSLKQPINNIPTDASQMILITSTFKGELSSKNFRPKYHVNLYYGVFLILLLEAIVLFTLILVE